MIDLWQPTRHDRLTRQGGRELCIVPLIRARQRKLDNRLVAITFKTDEPIAEIFASNKLFGGDRVRNVDRSQIIGADTPAHNGPASRIQGAAFVARPLGPLSTKPRCVIAADVGETRYRAPSEPRRIPGSTHPGFQYRDLDAPPGKN